MSIALPLLLAACFARPHPDAPDAWVDVPVAVVDFTWDCDAARGRWSLEADTTGWTGGAALWLTVNGAYVERHELRSVAAAPDGSADRLVVTLPIVADWRYVSPGASTAFTCGEDPSGRLEVFDRLGAPADCVEVGAPRPVWAAVQANHGGAPACPLSGPE